MISPLIGGSVLFRLAWRNLWRVPRRTAILFAAIGLGVWAMVVIGSIMTGMLRQMADREVRLLTGHLQIHRAGYFDDPVVDLSMRVPPELEREIDALGGAGAAAWAPRVRVPGLVANARSSADVTLFGVDPAREAAVSSIGQSIVEGTYLDAQGAHALVMGERLARKFGIRIGDKVVLTAEDAHDGLASRGFDVVGVFRTERKDVEDGAVFVLLPTLQSMLALDAMVSEVAVVFAQPPDVARAAGQLSRTLGPGHEVLTWEEAQPLLKAQLSLYESFTAVWYIAVGIGVAFGIANTLLMAIHDRFREFGVVKALGMKPSLIVGQVMIESALLLLMGTAAGSALGGPTVLWLSRTGIDLTKLAEGAAEWGMPRVVFPVLSVEDVLLPSVGVAVLGALVSFYPAWRGSRVPPVVALSQR
jgi:ABC-type lipoprotein release transport system permease subunit